MRRTRSAKWMVALLVATMTVMAMSVSASAQTSPGGEDWVTLTPAEVQAIQQTMLSGQTDTPCPSCKSTGQWDSNWESWLNNWSQNWGFATLKDGKINGNALSKMGFVPNYYGAYIILPDADPAHPAEWLTLSPAQILEIQKFWKSDPTPERPCPQCKATGQWDSNWEAWMNKWSEGWIYRTLSGGSISSLSLGQMGYVTNGDGKWVILDSPIPSEGGSWITLTSADTLKLQQTLQSLLPDRFGALNATGKWDKPWVDALYGWGQSPEWLGPPPDNAPAMLLNEARVAPALLDRLGFSINEVKALVP
jgi:hypothetical protein